MKNIKVNDIVEVKYNDELVKGRVLGIKLADPNTKGLDSFRIRLSDNKIGDFISIEKRISNLRRSSYTKIKNNASTFPGKKCIIRYFYDDYNVAEITVFDANLQQKNLSVHIDDLEDYPNDFKVNDWVNIDYCEYDNHIVNKKAKIVQIEYDKLSVVIEGFGGHCRYIIDAANVTKLKYGNFRLFDKVTFNHNAVKKGFIKKLATQSGYIIDFIENDKVTVIIEDKNIIEYPVRTNPELLLVHNNHNDNIRNLLIKFEELYTEAKDSNSLIKTPISVLEPKELIKLLIYKDPYLSTLDINDCNIVSRTEFSMELSKLLNGDYRTSLLDFCKLAKEKNKLIKLKDYDDGKIYTPEFMQERITLESLNFPKSVLSLIDNPNLSYEVEDNPEKIKDFNNRRNKIKLLVFDLGGVLYEGNINHFAQWFRTCYGKIKFSNSLVSLDSRLDRGEIDIIDYIKEQSLSYHNLSLREENDIIDKWVNNFVRIPKMFGLISSIDKTDLKIGALSNLNYNSGEYYKRQKHFKDFDELFFSYELKMVKPSKEIFLYMIGKMDLKPEEILFVDDQESNIFMAKKLGIKTILYTDEISNNIDSFSKLLMKYGIKFKS